MGRGVFEFLVNNFILIEDFSYKFHGALRGDYLPTTHDLSCVDMRIIRTFGKSRNVPPFHFFSKNGLRELGKTKIPHISSGGGIWGGRGRELGRESGRGK